MNGPCVAEQCSTVLHFRSVSSNSQANPFSSFLTERFPSHTFLGTTLHVSTKCPLTEEAENHRGYSSHTLSPLGLI